MARRGLTALALIVIATSLASCVRRPPEAAAAPAPVPLPAAPVKPEGTMSDSQLPAWHEPEERSVVSDLWYGVYMMGGEKVGWQRVRRSLVTWEGADAQCTMTETDLSVVTLGSPVRQTARQWVVSTPEGDPIRGHYENAGRVVEAVFHPDTVLYEATAAGGLQAGEFPVAEGKSLRDPDVAGAPEQAEVGFHRDYLVFEPLTLQLVEASYAVEDRETIEIGSKPRACLRARSELGSGTVMVSWLDAKTHDLVRMQSKAAKLDIRLEEKEAALAPPAPGAGLGRKDLATETRIVVEPPIAAPDSRRALKLRVSDLPSRKVLLSDGRQTWSDIVEEKGVLAASVAIRSQAVPTADGPVPPGQDSFRAASPHIQSDDARIRATVREIAPEGASAVRTAEALAKWVHGRVRSDASVGGLRSAVEVLEDPRGVCRDYAALYAALARAAGIPTKFCAGCVYWSRGQAPGFYYHAWNEVWLPKAGGGGEWVAVDCTRGEPWPVDATHVKFAEGEYGCMLDVVGLIGQLEMQVVE